jgi:hypothetical protein
VGEIRNIQRDFKIPETVKHINMAFVAVYNANVFMFIGTSTP